MLWLCYFPVAWGWIGWVALVPLLCLVRTKPLLTAPGYQTLITHFFVAGDPFLDRDAVFGVKDSLIAEFSGHEPGPGPGGRELSRPWTSLRQDIVLAREPGGEPAGDG